MPERDQRDDPFLGSVLAFFGCELIHTATSTKALTMESPVLNIFVEQLLISVRFHKPI